MKKLQSLDSKAVKLALGVPVHANTLNTYKEAGLLPLCEQRKLAVSKYVVRSLAVTNFVRDEIFMNQENDYLRRSKSIPFLQPICDPFSRMGAKVVLKSYNFGPHS